MLTCERLRELLIYDSETGIFRYRENRFSAGYCRNKAGDEAGSFNAKGYRQISIGRTYGAHRLAWLYMTGEWPTAQVDHINGDPADNRWSNLREATPSENARNRKVRSTNRAGVTGVYQVRRKFVAHITVDGQQVHLGTFPTISEAAAARAKAVNDHFGEYTRTA